MAELQGGLGYIANRGAPDILSGLQVGAGIAQRQRQQTLAEQQYMSGLKQLEIENARKAELDRQAKQKQQIDFTETNLKRAIRLGDYENADTLLKNLNDMTGANIQGNFEEMGKYFKEMDAIKDPAELEAFQKRFYDKFNRPIEIMAPVLGREDITKKAEEEKAKQKAIEEEQRKLELEKQKITAEKKAEIETEQAKIKATTEAVTAKEKADEASIRNALKKAKVDEVTINKIIAASKTGVGLPAEKALFPSGIKKDNIFFRPRYDEMGFKIGEEPIEVITDPKTGRMSYREIPRIEEPAVAETKPSEKQAVVSTPEQAALNYIKGTKKLGTLKHVRGALTLKEYLESVANNPQNVDEQGNIIVPEEDLFEDYSALLEAQKSERKDEGTKARDFLKRQLFGGEPRRP